MATDRAAATAALTAAGFDPGKLVNLPWAQILQLIMLALEAFKAQQPQPTVQAGAGCTDVEVLAECNVHCAANALHSALLLQDCCCPTP